MNQINSALATDKGRRRPHNEDYIAFFEPNDPRELQTSGNIYIVADGVGGAEKGERASRFAVQKVLFEYYRYPDTDLRERLKNAMRQAGNEIFEFAAESARPKRMATTMVTAVIHDQTLTVANVGDSRAYLIRNGRIEQITRDHSIVGEMMRNGLMTEEEASRSKVKNKITRSLGGEYDVQVDVFKGIPLHQGDMILLCSDGLTRYASSQDLLEMASQGSQEEAVEEMIKFANAAGGADNISAILIEVGGALDADQPTIPLPRGQVPEPVDWDTMQTQPSIKVKVKEKQSEPLVTKQHLLIGFALFMIVFVCGLIIVTFRLIVSIVSPTPTPTQFLAPTSTPVVETALPEILETESAVPDTPTVETATVDNLTLPGMITPTLTMTATLTAVPPALGDICIYQVKEGDMLSVVLTEFGLGYDKTNQYFFFESCTIDPPYCSEEEVLPESHLINTGYWLLIDLFNQEQCEAISDGNWITRTE
ncbi:Stp1/IreP family PP2C-type Ser/Thr phosphatase [Chloroflexota bacterium]